MQVAILKVEHCSFCICKLIYPPFILNKILVYFQFSIFEILYLTFLNFFEKNPYFWKFVYIEIENLSSKLNFFSHMDCIEKKKQN